MLSHIERVRKELEQSKLEKVKILHAKEVEEELKQKAFIEEMRIKRTIVEKVLKDSGLHTAFNEIISDIYKTQRFKKACIQFGNTSCSRMGASLVWGDIFEVSYENEPWMEIKPENDEWDYYYFEVDVENQGGDIFISDNDHWGSLGGEKRIKIASNQWQLNRDYLLDTIAKAYLNPIHSHGKIKKPPSYNELFPPTWNLPNDGPL